MIALSVIRGALKVYRVITAVPFYTFVCGQTAAISVALFRFLVYFIRRIYA